MSANPRTSAGVQTAAEFLRLLWPADPELGGHINVWTLQNRKSYWFNVHNTDGAAATIERLAQRADTYVGTALIDLKARKIQEAIDNRGDVNIKAIRGTNASAIAIPGVWVDLDIGGPIHGKAHKNSKLPPTIEDALALIGEAMPLPPTMVIDSGHGLYGWWLFQEPWQLENDADREEAANLVYRLQETVRDKARAHDWDVDGTADLARVLRCVGSINRKLEPVAVRVLTLDETRRYQPDDFERYLVDVEWRRIIADPVDLSSELPEVELDLLQLKPWIKKLIRDGNEWQEDKNAWRYGSRSQAVWRVINEMVEDGCDDDTIAAVLLDDRYRISENPLEKGRRARAFIAREIGKARKKQDSKPPEPTLDMSDGGFSPKGPRLVGAPTRSRHPSGTDSHVRPVDSAQLLEIDAGILDLPVVTAQAWSAINQANEREPFLFRYGGIPVRVERDDEARPILRELTVDHVRHELARVVRFYTVKVSTTEGEDGEKKQHKSKKTTLPPSHVCRDVLATRDQPLPIVTRITECPVFAADGSLQTTPGYHAASRTYLAIPPELVIPEVSDSPTSGDVTRAAGLILEDLLGDFPFVSPADLANIVALGLEPFVRAMILGPVPMHGVEAPVPGSGKGLLADAITRPSCGRTVGAIAQAKDDDEWRKRLTSLLERGFPVIQIDNVTRPLESGSLSMALTIPTWTDRILGQTRTISIPVRCSWVVTANNPTYSTEMARRTVRTRIDPRSDRPQDREGWKHEELLSWVDEHRGELIWAFCTLVRSWVAAGCPKFSGKALGSYERWSHVIGGILEHAGIEGFLANQADFYDLADVEAAIWRAFVATWWEKHQDKEVGTADLFPIAVATDGLELGNGQERQQKTRFGRLLGQQRDRVINGYRVTPSRISHKVQMWRLLPTDPGGLGDVGGDIHTPPHTRDFYDDIDTGENNPPNPPQPPRRCSGCGEGIAADTTLCESCAEVTA